MGLVTLTTYNTRRQLLPIYFTGVPKDDKDGFL